MARRLCGSAQGEGWDTSCKQGPVQRIIFAVGAFQAVCDRPISWILRFATNALYSTWVPLMFPRRRNAEPIDHCSGAPQPSLVLELIPPSRRLGYITDVPLMPFGHRESSIVSQTAVIRTWPQRGRQVKRVMGDAVRAHREKPASA